MRIELASEADSALIDIRFTRAQAQLALVDHPLVAQIIDHGVLQNGRPWVASERPPGTALSDVLAQRRLEPRETTALIYSVAQVLAFAHHRQVVHGALRPHHLTLSRGAKVSISGWAWLRTPGIPAFGDPANTSVYNPPEHDGQSPIDGRADVYALGAIAYRALTGVFPDVSRDLLDGNDPLGGAIENMLSLDARDRNSAAAIVADLHIQRQADRAAARERAASKSESEAPSRASSASIPELRSRASSPSIPEIRSSSPEGRASSPSIAPATSDLVERLARAEKEIEELRVAAAEKEIGELRAASARRESSENLRANVRPTRASSEDLRPARVKRASEEVRVKRAPDEARLGRASSDDLKRPSGARTIEIVSVLTPPGSISGFTPVPELEARPTNRMASPSLDQLEPVEQLDTELAMGTIDHAIDQPTEMSPPLEISSRDPNTDVEERCTRPMDASVPDSTDRFSV